jgi:hypothetical protein
MHARGMPDFRRRTRALIAAILPAAVIAACGPRAMAARTHAPAPVPPPVRTMVIPSLPTHRTIEVCVVQGGELVRVRARYSTLTGDTVFPTPDSSAAGSGGYAAEKAWYDQNELITLQADRYLKLGIVREMRPGDLVRVGEYGGVPLFVDAGEPARPPEMVYVPVRTGCVFQPYARDLLLGGVRGE